MRRFGRPLRDDLKPGLHWRWPWPVEEVTRVQPEQVHTVEVGFRTAAEAEPAVAWTGPARTRGDSSAVPDEAVMITGDGNLVELQASVRYRIAQPRVYLFEVARAGGDAARRRRVGAARGGRRPAVRRAADRRTAARSSRKC